MCFIFYFYLFSTVLQKEMPGGWTLWHYCISRKLSGYMYARGVRGYGYIDGYPWKICGYGYGYGW